MIFLRTSLILLFLSYSIFSFFDFTKKNKFDFRIKKAITLFINLVYIFFLTVYFLNKDNLNLNRFSEIYLILGLLLLCSFFIQEFFYSKSLSLFFIPNISFIYFIGIFYLNKETQVMTFNLIPQKNFSYLLEILSLLAIVFFFYSLILAILYRQLFLEIKFRKSNFLSNRLPKIDIIENLIQFFIISGNFLLSTKIFFSMISFLQKTIPFQNLLREISLIFIFLYFFMTMIFCLKKWLHSKDRLKWIYWGNFFTVIYLIAFY